MKLRGTTQAPNKIKEKIVYRMRNLSTKARTSNGEEDPHTLHLQEVLLQSHHTGPSMFSDIFFLSLSLTLILSLSPSFFLDFSLSPSAP